MSEQQIMRKIYKYENTKEDRKRLWLIPKKDYGQDFDLYSGIRCHRLVLARKLRQGNKIFRLAISTLIERITNGRYKSGRS